MSFWTSRKEYMTAGRAVACLFIVSTIRMKRGSRETTGLKQAIHSGLIFPGTQGDIANIYLGSMSNE
jgi:hypothetical protein